MIGSQRGDIDEQARDVMTDGRRAGFVKIKPPDAISEKEITHVQIAVKLGGHRFLTFETRAHVLEPGCRLPKPLRLCDGTLSSGFFGQNSIEVSIGELRLEDPHRPKPRAMKPIEPEPCALKMRALIAGICAFEAI